jgi:RNA polymerase sigma factor (sigma-70 family)
MTNEEHGREFLEYVAKNEARLKKNLRKNITYNPDIFDDVYQDTILKVYNRIMKGEVIKDFEQYFFIASKWTYINEDNKVKKRLKSDDNEFLYKISHGYEIDCNTAEARRYQEILIEDGESWEIKEEKNNKINELFKYLAERLNKVFPPHETDIFLIYYRLKSEKAGISYKKLSKITEMPLKDITQIIMKIKKFVKNDEEIINKKIELLK